MRRYDTFTLQNTATVPRPIKCLHDIRRINNEPQEGSTIKASEIVAKHFVSIQALYIKRRGPRNASSFGNNDATGIILIFHYEVFVKFIPTTGITTLSYVVNPDRQSFFLDSRATQSRTSPFHAGVSLELSARVADESSAEKPCALKDTWIKIYTASSPLSLSFSKRSLSLTRLSFLSLSRSFSIYYYPVTVERTANTIQRAINNKSGTRCLFDRENV